MNYDLPEYTVYVVYADQEVDEIGRAFLADCGTGVHQLTYEIDRIPTDGKIMLVPYI